MEVASSGIVVEDPGAGGKEVISSEVVGDLPVMLDSCCSAQPFHLINQLMPFQHEVNVVGVKWLN